MFFCYTLGCQNALHSACDLRKRLIFIHCNLCILWLQVVETFSQWCLKSHISSSVAKKNQLGSIRFVEEPLVCFVVVVLLDVPRRPDDS